MSFPTFRTTKQGEKVVFGTVRQVHPGNVKVSVEGARGGLERVKVLSLGKPFMVNGVEHVYGYLREATAAPATRPWSVAVAPLSRPTEATAAPATRPWSVAVAPLSRPTD